MPFTAQYQDYRVDATDFPIDLWNELKRSDEKHDLLCPDPDCDVQMIPKTYHRTGTQFFAHKTESQCPMSNGMTPEHLTLQNLVQKVAIDAGWQAKKEVYLPELRHESKRYVDVLATSPDDQHCRIAFEIQWSGQTPEKYIERTASYAKRGIRTYWISRKPLHGLYLLSKGIYNWTLSDDITSVHYDVSRLDRIVLSIEDFVKKVLTPDGVFVDGCHFTHGFHYCEGVECATSVGEAQHQSRQQEKKQEKQKDFYLRELRKCFYRYWCIIKETSTRFRLGKTPDEIFHERIKDYYNKKFDDLNSDDLEDVLSKIGWIDDFIAWLYPELTFYHKFWNRRAFSKKGRAVCEYARTLYRSNTSEKAPGCFCDSVNHTLGALKRSDGVFCAYVFCNRCGERSNIIAKSKFKRSELGNAYEWVKSKVNYNKTDFKPWAT